MIEVNNGSRCVPFASSHYDRPSVLLKQVFVKPIRCSQKPPYPGARRGVNVHIVPCVAHVACVDALSEIIVRGTDLRLVNLRNDCINDSSVRSGTTCTSR